MILKKEKETWDRRWTWLGGGGGVPGGKNKVHAFRLWLKVKKKSNETLLNLKA